MESNHPSVGLPRPAGFEDRMGHQTRAAPLASLGALDLEQEVARLAVLAHDGYVADDRH
jgi:hypothetical protein